MGLGLCVVGVSILLGITLNSERIYLLYLPPGFLLFLTGQLLAKQKP